MCAQNEAITSKMAAGEWRHRTTEFPGFLIELDRSLSDRPDVHLVMDSYATHKTPKVKAWLARRPH